MTQKETRRRRAIAKRNSELQTRIQTLSRPENRFAMRQKIRELETLLEDLKRNAANRAHNT